MAIGDVNEEAARETLDLVNGAGGDALLVRTNVAVEADVEKLVAATVERFGRLDCAFNNAGIIHTPRPIAHLDASTFDRVIAIDLRSVFLCMKYELRQLLKAGRGACPRREVEQPHHSCCSHHGDQNPRHARPAPEDEYQSERSAAGCERHSVRLSPENLPHDRHTW